MKPPTDTDTLPAPADAAVENPAVGIDQSAGNFSYSMDYAFDAGTGLSEDTIRYISSVKKEAPWILEFRLKALKKFFPMPRSYFHRRANFYYCIFNYAFAVLRQYLNDIFYNPISFVRFMAGYILSAKRVFVLLFQFQPFHCIRKS